MNKLDPRKYQKSGTVAIALFATAFLSPSNWSYADQLGEIIVQNEGLFRATSFANLTVPDDWKATHVRAINPDGTLVPIQIGQSGNTWLRVDQLAAGAERKIQLHSVESNTNIATGVVARRVGKTVEFWSGRKRILNYQAEPGELPRSDIDEAYRRGGYIHPIWSPNANVVTDDFPKDHVHHHGIWFPWTKTHFEGREPDFWNMGTGSGRVEFVQLQDYSSGPVFAELTTRHQFVDLLAEGGKTALNETWKIRVFATPEKSNVWLFDLESRQTCATDSPLVLPEYRYGGLGFRGHWDWNGIENTHFLTSNEETDRVKGHATRANWCYIGGDTDGSRTGIVVMCHPDNYRAPQPMRLHPTEPFFCFAPQQAGDMSIEPGDVYTSKYRFVVLDGLPDVSLIESLWHDYANPLEVNVISH